MSELIKFVSQIKAIDADEGPSAQIEYSIYEAGSSGNTELFNINKNTGGISLQKSAKTFGLYSIKLVYCLNSLQDFHNFCVFRTENQAFQFFVRATDRGSPALYADVSVGVYIMSSKDIPPVFEKNNDKILLPEEAVPGIVSISKSYYPATIKFQLKNIPMSVV